jgi:hypothetical protein
MNQVTLFQVQTHRHRIQGQIENFILHLKGKIRSMKFLKGIPDRFWSDLAKMDEAIHNFMEARVSTACEEGTSSIAVVKPVEGSSLGPCVFEGIFFGNEHSSPLVCEYIPSLGRLVLANEVKFFPDALPFLEPCFHNMQGFTERDLANFRLPMRVRSPRKRVIESHNLKKLWRTLSHRSPAKLTPHKKLMLKHRVRTLVYRLHLK